MDFDFSEETRAFRDVAAAFARDEFAPHAREWDEKSIFPVDTLKRAAALGFAAVYVADDVGEIGRAHV